MARRSAATQSINAALQKGRKSTQRKRLLSGITHVVAHKGYAAATITQVIAHAGVSRPTFYDYFADKDDCFLAALADVQERLLADVRGAVEAQAPEQATVAAVEALVRFASSEPPMARFLMNEPMAAGPRALDARDRGIAQIAQIIEEAQGRVPSAMAIPDLPSRMLLGGIYRLLSARLRRSEPGISGLVEDLLRWIKSYEQPAGKHRWRTLQPVLPPAALRLAPDARLRAPMRLPLGRPRLSKEEVAENHRQRIMFATAQVAQDKGYTATTIADITMLAGVDGRVFYAFFAGKQDAFMAIHELGFQRTMAVTAGAFFAGATWPERVWEAGRAFTQFLENNPMIVHVEFVEAYAVGPGAIERIEGSRIAFTIFLQEGYQHEPQDAPPSRLALEAIVTTIFEIVYHQARGNANPQLSGLLPHMTFLWLAPFLGPARANEFIDQKM